MRSQDYISLVRQKTQILWQTINEIEAMQHEWQALDYGSTLEDGSGENVKQTRADIGAVVFDTMNAMRDLLNAGHATNLARLL